MISFESVIEKFGEKGEKTGWTYIDIPSELAEKIQPNVKKAYRVRGSINGKSFSGIALTPMGGGHFILSLKAELRKSHGLRVGQKIAVELEYDDSPLTFNVDLMECLELESNALIYFQSLAPSHQKYFSNWIDQAKTLPTKEKRIQLAIQALSLKLDFATMLRNQKN